MTSKRNIVIGATLVALLAVLFIGQSLLTKAAAQTASGLMAPKFEVDPNWPKPLPNGYQLGQTIGVAIDAQDHVWIVHRANPDDVEALLTGVGFEAIEFTSFEEPLWFGADADAAYAFVGGIGIVKGLSDGLDEVARADAHEKLKAALRSHETPEGVRFGSAVWLITARKS